MASRMDRYRDEEENISRSMKNQELYENTSINSVPERPVDINNTNALELNGNTNLKTRENYHRVKELGLFEDEKPEPEKKLDDFNMIYEQNGKKVYDINTILEEAKKDNSEKTSTNLSLTKEEIENYKKEKEEKDKKDTEKMKELINTITSKTLKGEIDQATSVDLLSDLMATSDYDRIANNTEVLDKEALDEVKKRAEEREEVKPKEIRNVDDSFYTKSMELSTKDFDLDDSFVEEKKMPGVLKVLLVILLLALVGVLIYFIIKSF